MKINTDNNCNLLIEDDIEYPVKGLYWQTSVSLFAVVDNTLKTGNVKFYVKEHNYTSEFTEEYVMVKDYILNTPDIDSILSGNYTAIDYDTSSDESNNSIIVENRSPIVHQTNHDSYYTIYHLVLPIVDGNSFEEYLKQKWLITNTDIDNLEDYESYESLQTVEDAIDYQNTYGYNLEQQKFVKIESYDNGELNTTDIRKEELLQLFIEAPNTNFNFYSEQQNYLSVCSLWKCYKNLCYKIFNNKVFDQCFNNKNIDASIIYKRDLVWAALNVIDYMTEMGQYQEAANLLTRITGCNGLCSKDELETSGCGCES